MNAIFSEDDLRQMLDAIRTARTLRRSPLYDLQQVRLRVAALNHLPSAEECQAALSELIARMVLDTLSELRSAHSGRRWNIAGPISAESQIQGDFGVDDPDLEAWSILYFRYLAPRTYQVKQLTLWTQPSAGTGALKQSQRRIKRGIELLTKALRDADIHQERDQTPAQDGHTPHLPRRRTRFFDREAILAEAGQRLGEGALLCFVGPPGVGKTRLALQLAAAHQDAYPGGVWWVVLDQVENANLVLQAIAYAGGVVDGPAQSLRAAVVAALQERPPLLVLDSCEHFTRQCSALTAELLEAAPRLAIVATSQQRLHFEGGFVIQVPTLALPSAEEAAAAEPGELLLYPAVALFVDRAATASSRFALTPHNQTAVADVCRAVDGLPLAVELAAGRLAALSMDQLRRRLDDPLDILVSTMQGVPGHQPNIAEAIGNAVALLGDLERRLFARLAVFRGGFTLAAAEQVCGAMDDSLEGLGAPLIDMLTGLVDKSLVFVEERDRGVRYQMLRLIGAYAESQLAVSGERPALVERHLLWCLGLVQRDPDPCANPHQAGWAAQVNRESENIQAALEYAARSNPERGLELAEGLADYWMMRGQLTEGRRWFARFLAMRSPDADQSLVARAMRRAGNMARLQSDFRTAAQLLEEALAASRCAADGSVESDVLQSLGILADQQGDNERARDYHEQSLALATSLGDRWRQALIHHNRGLIEYHSCEYDRAQASLEASVQFFREQGAHSETSRALNNLGKVAAARGDFAAAKAMFSEARRTAAELGDLATLSISEEGLGYVAAQRGELAVARSYYRSAVATFRQRGDRFKVTQWLEKMVDVCMAEGHPERATQILAAASMLRERLAVASGERDRADNAATADLLVAELGQTSFGSHWKIGRSLGWEQAVDLALGED